MRRLHGAKQRGSTRLELFINVFVDALFFLLGGCLGLPILRPHAVFFTLLVFRSAFFGNDLLGFSFSLRTLIVAHDFGHVGTKAAFFRHDGATISWVFAQLTATLWGRKELFCKLLVKLIRRSGLRQVRALVFRLAFCVHANLTLNIRTVAADAHKYIAAFGIGVQTDRVDLAGIDVFQVDIDKRFQPTVTCN